MPRMKTTSHLTLALTASLTLISCDRAPTKTAEVPSATEATELAVARAQAAEDKAAAQVLRDEAEHLRDEAALRTQITQLAESAEAPDAPAPEPAAPAPLPAAPQMKLAEDESYQPFYNDLSSDGSWMNSPDYGYVWQPSISITINEWAPYVDGSWSYTDYGWAWQSPERFSHICYHYGRWTRLRNVGWVWVPGREWAPAWVSWRSSDECVGWAPLPPAARWHSSLGISSWVDGVCHLAPSAYVFVATQNLCHPSCKEVLYPRQDCERHFLQCRNVTRLTLANTNGRDVYVKNEGPPVEALRHTLGDHFREQKIHFGDQRHDAPRVQPTVKAGELAMSHWTLRKETDHLGKPATIAKQLDRGLEMKPEISAPQQANIQKVIAQDAQRAVQTLTPPLATNKAHNNDRGPGQTQAPPRANVVREQSAPVVTSKPPRPAPPAQGPLEPYHKPDVTPNVVNNEHLNRPSNPPQPPVASVRPSPAPPSVNNQRPIEPAAAPAEQPAQAPIAQRQAQENQAAEQRQQRAEAQQKQLSRKQQEEADRQQHQVASQRQAMDEQRQQKAQQADQQRTTEAQQAQDKQRLANQQRQAQAQTEGQRKQQAAVADRQAAMQQQEANNGKQQADTQQAALRQQQAEAQQQADAQRAAQQEAMQQKQADAQRKQQADAQRAAQMDAQRKQQEDTARQQQMESQRQAQLDAQRQQQESMRQQQAETSRRQQEDTHRAAQQESMRRQQEDTQKRQQEATKPRASGR